MPTSKIEETKIKEVASVAEHDVIPFTTLDEAEHSLFVACDAEERSKLDQVRSLISIKRNKLYDQRVDLDTGKPFSAFETYLKSIEPELERRGAGKKDSIKKWISSYVVYCEQMGKSEKWFLDMGQHAKELMRGANLTHYGPELEYETIPSPHGGTLLGRVDFEKFVDEVAVHVFSNNPDFPETSWKVSDTRAAVNELLGKPDSPKWEWDVELTAEGKVRVKEFTVFLGDSTLGFAYHGHMKELIPVEHFKQMATGKIYGLDDNP